jgi:hypothetical protein
MSIDKQRITGVKVLEALGYTFDNEWKAPAGAAVSLVAEADRMHALLVHRADQLRVCCHVSFPGKSGRRMIALEMSGFEPKPSLTSR